MTERPFRAPDGNFIGAWFRKNRGGTPKLAMRFRYPICGAFFHHVPIHYLDPITALRNFAAHRAHYFHTFTGMLSRRDAHGAHFFSRHRKAKTWGQKNSIPNLDADAFKKHGNDLCGLFCLNTDALQGLALAECRIAIQTTESLNATISILIEASLLDWAGTTMTACHNSVPFVRPGLIVIANLTGFCPRASAFGCSLLVFQPKNGSRTP